MSERDIFLAAIDIPETADRLAFLDQACAGNEILRAQVDALLRAYADPQSFLAQPAVEQVAARPGDLPPQATPAAPNAEATRSFSPHDPDGVLSGLLSPSTVPGSLGRLGHFEVQQILGAGGFGTVLRAFDDKLHRMVAIKLMSAEMASTSPARKRFLREARAAAAIRHEHVVNIYSVEEEPLPYLVMEFIPGQTLEQKLNSNGPLELSEVLRLGEQIAQGLAAAHAMGLVHRDIKPANILLESGVKERVKITDFGLARTADDATVTQSGVIAGTPMYMAPEQAWGQPLDQRADLFSLGSVLYQMVSGRPPFRAETTLAVLKRVTEDTPRPIREFIPEAPIWLCAIIAKLQAKQPEDRIQTAGELAELLAECRKSIEQGKEPKLPWPALEAPVRTTPPAAQVVQRPVSAPARIRLIPGRAWIVGALGLLVVVAFWLLRTMPGSGTLVIEVNDPEISIIIKADGRAVHKLGKGVRDPRMDLRPGRYTVVAEKNRQLLSEAEVEIKRGHRDVLKLDLTSKNLAAAPSPSDPDHRAAEYVLSIGGTISIRENGQQRGLEAGGDLPRGTYELTHVNLLFNHKVSDAGLANFKDCRNVTSLILSGTQLSDAGLAHFKDCKHLSRLDLGATPVSDAGLAHLKDCTNLTDIRLNNTQVKDAGLVQFKDYENLIYLAVHNTQVTDSGLAHIANCRKLGNLIIMNAKVTEAGLKKLVEALPGCKIEWDGGVIDPTPSTNPDRLAAEWVLSIGGTIEIKEKDQIRAIKAGGDLPQGPFELTVVDLAGNSQVTDEGLACFRTCHHLKSLSLQQTRVSDAGLPHFQHCKQIELLNLYHVQVSDAGLAHFKDCKNLTILNVAQTLVTDAGLAHFKDCQNLTLIVVSNTQVGDAGLAHIQNCTKLTTVTLGATQVTDAGMAYLRNCRNLLTLTLNTTRVGDLGLAHLKDCQSLNSVNLFGTQVTDAGLTQLKGWKNLNDVNLKSLKITDAGLAELKDCQQLTQLWLDENQISDAGLEHLAGCSTLKVLGVTKTKVTEAGVKKLAAALPGCKIEWDGGVIAP